jgi:hypothetical protein
VSQRIDVRNIDSQSFTTVLGSQRVRFFIYFQESRDINAENGWFADVELLSGDNPSIVMLGSRLQTFQSILHLFTDSFFGAILVIPISVPFEDLTQDSPWGVSHILEYFTQDEVNSFGETFFT